MGLLPECAAWTERAIGALDTLSKGTRLELELLACFATSLMVTKGNVPAAHTALVRALDIAERLNAARMQLYILHALYRWQVRSGDFRGLRELTARIETVAKEIADPAAGAIATWLPCLYMFLHRRESRSSQACADRTRRPGSLIETEHGDFWIRAQGKTRLGP